MASHPSRSGVAAQQAKATTAVRALGTGPVQLAKADERALLYTETSYRHLIQAGEASAGLGALTLSP